MGFMKTNEGRAEEGGKHSCGFMLLSFSQTKPQQLCESLVSFRPSSVSPFILREPDLAGRDPPVQIAVQGHERLALRVREEEGVGLDRGQVEALPPQPVLLPFERAWNVDGIGFPLSDISGEDKRNAADIVLKIESGSAVAFETKSS